MRFSESMATMTDDIRLTLATIARRTEFIIGAIEVAPARVFQLYIVRRGLMPSWVLRPQLYGRAKEYTPLPTPSMMIFAHGRQNIHEDVDSHYITQMIRPPMPWTPISAREYRQRHEN